MEQKDFSERLSSLRIQKGVSAREMSLSIGQSPGYINSIESGVGFPSMSGFFYICDYLGITPMDFFDFAHKSPAKTASLLDAVKPLNDKQIELLIDIAKNFK